MLLFEDEDSDAVTAFLPPLCRISELIFKEHKKDLHTREKRITSIHKFINKIKVFVMSLAVNEFLPCTLTLFFYSPLRFIFFSN